MCCLSPKRCWELCMCISPVQTHHWGTYRISRLEQAASLTAGAAPEALSVLLMGWNKTPSSLLLPLLLWDTTDTTRSERLGSYSPGRACWKTCTLQLKAKPCTFSSATCSYHLSSCAQRPEQTGNLTMKALTRETTETGNWEKKQPANQGVPQLLIEICACKQENPSDILS